jgi:hypothetical protein
MPVGQQAGATSLELVLLKWIMGDESENLIAGKAEGHGPHHVWGLPSQICPTFKKKPDRGRAAGSNIASGFIGGR